MGELKIGQEIKTKGFKTVKVLDEIGGGGQGTVYRVEYGGKQMALKWYFAHKLKNGQRFYDNISHNMEQGRPTDAFLWPEDITEWVDGSFGYIMPLKPREYGDFSKYLLAREKFSSVGALVNTALNIVKAFDALHQNGYNYQDLNDGNFFVNFKTGDVLICDNDNVMGHGFSSGIAGKCRYMAPEVVLGKNPDKQTDRYSLAVVLFLLLFVNHPLEGKATNPPCMTEELEKKYYGTDPIFICDPTNPSNAPIRNIHQNVIAKWPVFPSYIKEAFVRSFSNDCLHGKKPRLLDSEWLKLFIRLKSELLTCGCGCEVFADATKSARCPACGKTIPVPAHLQFKRFNQPLSPAVKLYACHTVEDSTDFKTVTAEVIVSKNTPGVMGLRNLSENVWYVIGADGNPVPKKNGEVVRIAGGLTIDFGKGVTAKIVAN